MAQPKGEELKGTCVRGEIIKRNTFFEVRETKYVMTTDPNVRIQSVLNPIKGGVGKI